MKKRKFIIFIILIVAVAILVGTYIFFSSYMFDEDGKITNSYNLFYERLDELNSDSEKQELIKFGIENNIISEEKAKNLLEK